MYTYDDQLLDAVKVRRKRLAQALLHRSERLRRTWTDGLGTMLGSIFFAVLACAVCVGVSFVMNLIANDTTFKRQPTQGTSITAPATPPTSPASTPPSADEDKQ
ncbi:Uncharacterised protein [Mycobacteroides abscessus subsp. abscessus]|uniref:Uncharacterized protein n=1 Tax=Dermabacter vaginalis TaxID=1630135 RepID=A0ABX6A280_9MICO|nr:hypothetical protein [Dermabacter vaginalis]MCG7444305.1 hypothetical protein [Dermabacter vaginalis]QEU10932.1 hypothetical protein FOB48_00475 [Dermabacter vaginalis]SHY17817.1 Uncharacterised protein [Mycobacteroides abscessus subsp. abscessus]